MHSNRVYPGLIQEHLEYSQILFYKMDDCAVIENKRASFNCIVAIFCRTSKAIQHLLKIRLHQYHVVVPSQFATFPRHKKNPILTRPTQPQHNQNFITNNSTIKRYFIFMNLSSKRPSGCALFLLPLFLLYVASSAYVSQRIAGTCESHIVFRIRFQFRLLRFRHC